MNYRITIFAQGEGEAKKASTKQDPAKNRDQEPGGMGGIFGNPLMLFAMLGLLFWFVVLRPARRQEQVRKSMLSDLKKSDKVVTNAGIIGTVMNMKENDESVKLRIDENSTVTVLRSSIARVIRDEEEKKS